MVHDYRWQLRGFQACLVSTQSAASISAPFEIDVGLLVAEDALQWTQQ